MQVFTYYARLPIAGALGPLKMLKNHRDQNAMIRLWKQTWQRNGWEPIVLGETDALRADAWLARQIMDARHLYRSPNPKSYEMACYLRWVAMTARGGLMTDYDVMNLRFTPDNWAHLQTQFDPSLPISLGGGVPCCVGGTREGFGDLVNLFLEFEAHPNAETPRLQLNVSDQNIMASSPMRFQTPQPLVCAHYGNEIWQSAPLLHVPHIQVKTNRVRALRRIIAEANANANAATPV